MLMSVGMVPASGTCGLRASASTLLEETPEDRMKQFEPDESKDGLPLAEILAQWFHAATTVFGLILIAVGIYFACQLFGAAYSAVTAPEEFGPVVEQWSEYVSGGDPLLIIDDRAQINPRLIALIVLGFCTLVMIWITKAVITIGAKIVYWMGSDLDSVKRVLSHVFGPTVIDVVKGPTEKPSTPFDGPDDKPKRR